MKESGTSLGEGCYAEPNDLKGYCAMTCHHDHEKIKPFQIAIDEAVLEDLRARLRRTRWPDAGGVTDWSQGVPLAWMREICAYWEQEYDWRAREALLNRFDQFTTVIDGVEIHFMHVRSPHPDAMPLLLTHGWPGSVVEFVKVIEPLTNPLAYGGKGADAFHIVCPSLPGFGFSSKPSSRGWNLDRIAAAWAQLMARLGYPRYGAQGGDWGSSITASLGAHDPSHCAGIHITLAMGSSPPSGSGVPSAIEVQALERGQHYHDWESGYAKQQSTRPQTLGYGLADSAVGQAAWILEKFHAWSDCGSSLESIFTRDELLDNVMLYWATGSATSSARLYWESNRLQRLNRLVEIPTGVAVYPKEIFPPVRGWMEARFRDIRHWREMPKGGHFAAFEQPELFVSDLREYFQILR